MTRTRQEILDELAADPRYATLTDRVNKADYVLTPAERQARLEQWADDLLAREQRQEAQAAEREERRRVVRALQTLDTNIATLAGPPAPTAAQVRDAVLDNARILRGLIEALAALGLLDRDSQ